MTRAEERRVRRGSVVFMMKDEGMCEGVVLIMCCKVIKG